MTITRAKISVSLPKKKSSAHALGHQKSLNSFFKQLYSAVVKHVDMSAIKCVLIGSPGFLNNDFMTFLFEEAAKDKLTDFTRNKDK